MSRNNQANIKKHNDKLHKAEDKAKKKKEDRKAQLKAIMKKYNSENNKAE